MGVTANGANFHLIRPLTSVAVPEVNVSHFMLEFSCAENLSDIAKEVQTCLSTSAAVIAICPAARIKTPGQHQNLTRPYIIHQPISGTQNRTHSGRVGRLWDSYQVSIFVNANDDALARSLADAVISALDA